MNMTEAAATGILALIAIAGTLLDIRFRRLPNWLCAVAAVAGLASGFAIGGVSWAGMSALHALIALIIGMAVFATGAIGGGDAKFYAAIAAWFPLGKAPLLLGAVSIAGLLLLIAWLPVRKYAMSGSSKLGPDDAFRKLPYGVAISTGAFIAFLTVAFSA